MDDAEQLIERLLTAAGMIMEDAAEVALIRDNANPVPDRIAAITMAGNDIAALACAAAIIARRRPKLRRD